MHKEDLPTTFPIAKRVPISDIRGVRTSVLLGVFLPLVGMGQWHFPRQWKHKEGCNQGRKFPFTVKLGESNIP